MVGVFSDNLKAKIENPKWWGILAIAVAFAICGAVVEAQQPGKVPRVGYLTPSTSPNRSYTQAFRQGLRDLGYVEGKNLVIEWRANEGKLDRNPALAAELVRLKVDVIVAVGSAEIRAAKEATAAIAIVMVRGGDPVGSGLVDSLARPGGNITGLAPLRPENGQGDSVRRETTGA